MKHGVSLLDPLPYIFEDTLWSLLISPLGLLAPSCLFPCYLTHVAFALTSQFIQASRSRNDFIVSETTTLSTHLLMDDVTANVHHSKQMGVKKKKKTLLLLYREIFL